MNWQWSCNNCGTKQKGYATPERAIKAKLAHKKTGCK